MNHKKHTLYHSYKCLLFNEMLIHHSNTWLPEKDGIENMTKKMRKNARNDGKNRTSHIANRTSQSI